MSNFKDTLNILKTDFEMKANLHLKEPEIQKKWMENRIYEKSLQQNKNSEQWILHDGPPYANGDIHVGHALNKILKDIIVRNKTLNGFYSPYIPGWDTHGLPIEHALLKKNINKDPNLTINQKRDNCKKFAIENVEKQKSQFLRLGMFSDFEEIYLTLYPDFETRQLNLFKKIVEKKLIYQDLKPVYWSWASQTALAEAEIEYGDVKSPSIHVAFDVTDENSIVKKNDKLIIWTTTPWTIPSNLAIAVHPNFEYVRFSHGENFYVVSKERYLPIVETFGWNDSKVVRTFSGADLENVHYKHCLYDKNNPVILADYVSNDDGTGLVHNAPGFGMDDYLACKKYNISVFCPIDNLGKFTSEVNDEELVGLFYDESNKLITERMKENGSLLKLSFITHSVAHDWRSKKPVIYRATKQWFIDIKSIQSKLLDALDDVKFFNESNRKQITDMIKNRSEWCISRQRVWGTPIPIIFDENDKPIYDHDLINNIIEILSKESTNAWFEKPVEYFLTEKYREQKCRKETDIMDVWFDSGSSFTLLKAKGLNEQANLYIEGNDQYRGWFNSSLICSVILNGKAPYKQLISHGFTLDENEIKMSKSLGNTIDPLAVCQQNGADILRLWVANTNFQDDMKISKNILDQTGEIYRRIRNTLFKFILANISDFNYDSNKNFEFDVLDTMILSDLKSNLEKIKKSYEEFDFQSIVRTINGHVIELSSWYFDVIKDTLYCEEKDNNRRRSIQTVLYLIFENYLFSLAPIIPHTCEEAYTFWNSSNKKQSIFLDQIHNSISDIEFENDENLWEELKTIKSLANLTLEKIRAEKIINKNNEADIELSGNIAFKDGDALRKILNVASVKINQNSDEKISAVASKTNYEKCERCWNYFKKSEIDQDQKICKRCAAVMSKK